MKRPSLALVAALFFGFVGCTLEQEAPEIKVESITIDQEDLTLTEGESVTLTATVLPENAADKTIKWCSSNEGVVMIASNGKAKALIVGSAEITATAGEKTDFITITVASKTIPVTGISLNPCSLTITVGESQTIVTEITPSDATDKSVTWSSSNPTVASVENGTVTGLKPGSVTITATTTDGGKTADCAVNVKTNLAPSVTVGHDHLSAVGATLKGKANLSSSAAADLMVGFQYSLSPGILPSNSDSIMAENADSDYNYSADLSGLEPSTTYYYRSFIRENGQYTFGETKEFTTREITSLIAADTSMVSAVGAILKAFVDYTNIRYRDASVGFYWGEAKDELDNKAYICEEQEDYSIILFPLQSPNEYFYQPFIILNHKEYKGMVGSFTTEPNNTLLETLDATEVEQFSAVLNATIDYSIIKPYLNDSYSYSWNNGFCIWNGDYCENDYEYEAWGGDWSDSETYYFFQKKEYLYSNTTYSYKPYLKLGDTKYYGSIKQFTTLPVPVESVSLAVISDGEIWRPDFGVLDRYTLYHIGDTVKLVAEIQPYFASNKNVSWASDNESVAIVNQDGRVTAISNGTANITATTVDQKKTASCQIKIAHYVDRITLSKSCVSLSIGEKATLSVTDITPDNAPDKSFRWSSSDESVAIVNSNGVVTAVGSGFCAILATANDEGGVSAACAVSVDLEDMVMDVLWAGGKSFDSWIYIGPANYFNEHTEIVPGDILRFSVQPRQGAEDWTIHIWDGNWRDYLVISAGNAPEGVYDLVLTQQMIEQLRNIEDWGPGVIIANGCDCTLYMVTLIHYIAKETTIWEGSYTGDWSQAMTALSWGGYDWSTVKAGTRLAVTYTITKTPSEMCIKSGDWGAIPSLQQYEEWGVLTLSGTSYEFNLTSEDLNELINNNGLVIYGDGFILTQVILKPCVW